MNRYQWLCRALMFLALGIAAAGASSGAAMGNGSFDYFAQSEAAYLAACGREHEGSVCVCSKEMIDDMINPLWFATVVDKYRGDLWRDARLGSFVSLTIDLCEAGE